MPRANFSGNRRGDQRRADGKAIPVRFSLSKTSENAKGPKSSRKNHFRRTVETHRSQSAKSPRRAREAEALSVILPSEYPPSTPGRAREDRSPLAHKSFPATCASGTGADFCVGKSHFPEQKSLPCTICGQSFRRKLKQIVVGVAVAGELAPPSPPAWQKDFFDKLTGAASHGGGSSEH